MHTTPQKTAIRKHESLLAGPEKRILIWMAERMPAWVSPDKLTILGFLSMFLAGASYYLASREPLALFAVIVFLATNWFGDSLDGTLARVRQKPRPRYGYYVDHVVDTFGTLFLIGGMGLSGYMSGTVAMALLIAYYIVSCEVYLSTHVLGVFKLNFGWWGPTELRILLAVGNVIMFVHPTSTILGRTYLLADVGAIVAIVGLGGVVIVNSIRNTARLYDEERVS